MVLMYHRIAHADYDPWQLCVTPENFSQQLEVLCKRFNVIPVSELLNQVSNKRVQKKTVCITFDDGYTDNFLEAKPRLESFKCPATFFIASHYINSGSLFWWDKLEDILLSSPSLPNTISFNIKDKEYQFEISDTQLTASDIAKQKAWQWPGEAPNERCKVYLGIWEVLLPNDYAEIKTAMEEICRQTNYKMEPPAGKIPMSSGQLQSLSSNELFEVGLHTSTHPALSFHSAEYQLNELLMCRKFLEPAYQSTVNTVAYPFGRFNETTVDIAKRANVKAGFTTQGKPITKKSDLLSLGRFQVNNWNEDQFIKQLDYWAKMS